MPVKDPAMLVGNTLKRLRIEKNVSVKKICEDLKMPESTYRTYETNIRVPNPQLLCVFADYFEVTVDYLLSYVPVTSEHGVEYYQQLMEKSLEQMQEYERTIKSCVEKIRTLTSNK